MEISGKIIDILTPLSGQSASGAWTKQPIIIETEGRISRKVCLDLWGDLGKEISLEVGRQLKAQIDVYSREHNGKWYTEARAWRIEVEKEVEKSGFPEVKVLGGIGSEKDELPF